MPSSRAWTRSQRSQEQLDDRGLTADQIISDMEDRAAWLDEIWETVLRRWLAVMRG